MRNTYKFRKPQLRFVFYPTFKFLKSKRVTRVRIRGWSFHCTRFTELEKKKNNNQEEITNAADVILWRNKQLSASMLAASTVIWLLFERVGYHVLSFICNSLILSLAALFLWSNLSSFLNKSPPVLPELSLPEDVTMKVALLLRQYINKAFMVLTDVASKKDVKKFLYVILGLYVISVVASNLVLKDSFHNVSMGIAYIIFEEESARSALMKRSGTLFCGHVIGVTDDKHGFGRNAYEDHESLFDAFIFIGESRNRGPKGRDFLDGRSKYVGGGSP
ncbi:hypothetical protein POM88_019235 [Heracleum sosnowskyi]|uniref:Reticulon-like protein n=1 Tax=Heracleum sosnowskyi TaxID=360622 RepID=A0AAD8IRZ0_9APIA|nr:hypothetical protein POM88_019235 [Heracleum sosnowskyi]